MPVNVEQSLREGLRRTISRNGLLLIVVWALVGSASLLAYNSWFASLFTSLPTQPRLIGPTLDISPLIAGVATGVLYLVSFVVMAGALRTFVTDERQALPVNYFTRNLGWMLVNLLVGYVLFFIVLWIGFLLLIVPGMFLLVSLFFWFVIVVVEDRNFYVAFRESWALAKGNRWSLLGIGLTVTVVGWVLMGIPMVLSFVLSPWVAWVLLGVSVSVFGIFSMATTAQVYVQLTSGNDAPES
jgi:hypothetical protein